MDKTRLSRNLMNQSLTKNVSFNSIFKENYVWVGGGILVATKDVFLKYHRAVVYFLRRGLMNADQQVIYGIYCNEGRRVFSPEVDLQLFWSSGSRKVWTSNVWFYLGYLCLEEIWAIFQWNQMIKYTCTDMGAIHTQNIPLYWYENKGSCPLCYTIETGYSLTVYAGCLFFF